MNLQKWLEDMNQEIAKISEEDLEHPKSENKLFPPLNNTDELLIKLEKVRDLPLPRLLQSM